MRYIWHQSNWHHLLNSFRSRLIAFSLVLDSREGHVNIVQELLSRGANVNAATKVRERHDRTLVHLLLFSFV